MDTPWDTPRHSMGYCLWLLRDLDLSLNLIVCCLACVWNRHFLLCLDQHATGQTTIPTMEAFHMCCQTVVLTVFISKLPIVFCFLQKQLRCPLVDNTQNGCTPRATGSDLTSETSTQRWGGTTPNAFDKQCSRIIRRSRPCTSSNPAHHNCPAGKVQKDCKSRERAASNVIRNEAAQSEANFQVQVSVELDQQRWLITSLKTTWLRCPQRSSGNWYCPAG